MKMYAMLMALKIMFLKMTLPNSSRPWKNHVASAITAIRLNDSIRYSNWFSCVKAKGMYIASTTAVVITSNSLASQKIFVRSLPLSRTYEISRLPKVVRPSVAAIVK